MSGSSHSEPGSASSGSDCEPSEGSDVQVDAQSVLGLTKRELLRHPSQSRLEDFGVRQIACCVGCVTPLLQCTDLLDVGGELESGLHYCRDLQLGAHV